MTLDKGTKVHISVLSLYFKYGTKLEYEYIHEDPDDYADYCIVDKNGDYRLYHGHPAIIGHTGHGCVNLLNEFGKPFRLTPEELVQGMMLQGEVVCLKFNKLYKKLKDGLGNTRICRLNDGAEAMIFGGAGDCCVIRTVGFDSNEGCEYFSYALWDGRRDAVPVDTDSKCFMIGDFDHASGRIRVTSIADPAIAASLSAEDLLACLDVF